MTRVFTAENVGVQTDFSCYYHNSKNYCYMRIVANIRAGVAVRVTVETFGTVPVGELFTETAAFYRFLSRFIAGESVPELNDCCTGSIF